MSLVATWAQAHSGAWYEEPLLSEPNEESDIMPWFVCYDDDDPIELVIRADTDSEAKEKFEQIKQRFHDFNGKIRPTKDSKLGRGGLRDFGARDIDMMSFHQAYTCWVVIANLPDELIVHEDRIIPNSEKDSVYMGCYYPLNVSF